LPGTEDGKFTITDISVALGMTKEEKTMSRILNELKKCHSKIQSSAVRNGRVFQYKYYLQGVKKDKGAVVSNIKDIPKKREFKEEEK
jgi:hypothetical protein